MGTPVKPLRCTVDGRKYYQWLSPSKFWHCDSTILFPTEYRWHSDAKYKWICPIRDCRNVFELKQDLSDHTVAFHQNLQLNDNLDGTASVVGYCLSEYPQIISRGRPSRSAPSAAEPCLPSVSPQALRVSLAEPLKINVPPSPVISEASLHAARDEQNVTPVSPITARLNAARRYHKEQSVPANVLRSAAVSPSVDQHEDDSGVAFCHDIDLHTPNGSRQERSVTLLAETRTTPSPADKNEVPKTPVDSTSLFVTPRSSERLLLRRLSASGSGIGIDPESPSARRSARIKDKGKTVLPSPGTMKKGVVGAKLNRKSARNLAPINTKRLGVETGPRSAVPSAKRVSPGARMDSSTSTSNTGTSERRQYLTRINDIEAEIDARMGRSVSEYISNLETPHKRTPTLALRRDIHMPHHRIRNTSVASLSDTEEQYVNDNGTEVYLTPPKSQEHPNTGTVFSSPKKIEPSYLWPSPNIRMESWELAPGTISSPVAAEANSPLDSNIIAYSSAYLCQPSAVPISPGVGVRVLHVQPGSQELLAGDAADTTQGSFEQNKTIICIVTSGKATVRVTDSVKHEVRDFSVGRGGLIQVERGRGCLVMNKLYELLSLQVMEIAM